MDSRNFLDKTADLGWISTTVEKETSKKLFLEMLNVRVEKQKRNKKLDLLSTCLRVFLSFTYQTVASEQGKQEQLEEKYWKGDLTNKVGQEAEQKTAGTMQKMR
jgi:hypothetical protein